MRRSAPLAQRRSLIVRLAAGVVIAIGVAFATIQAQIPGRNVNMVSGAALPGGDPFLQRQNEPSIAASTRNPLHLLGGANDYRTVDVPGLPDGAETGDAWLGLFKSTDGGQRWASTLLPGYPQDASAAGLASPLKGYQAGADPVVRAGTNGLFYYSGLVFDRGEGGKSGIFISRFIDNNNQEAGDPVAYLGTVMVARSSPGTFLDKPWMAVDIPRANAPTCTITADHIIETEARMPPRWGRGGRRRPAAPAPGTQRIKAGAVYVAYTSISGTGDALRAEIFLTRSTDCGASWSDPIRVSAASDPVNQGASLTINPLDGSVFVAWRRFSTLAKPDLDGVMTARLPFAGKKFDPPSSAYAFPKRKGQKVGRRLDRIFEHGRVKARPSEAADVDEFDQGTSPFSFRTNAYPATATDGSGRVYIAWTQRGFAEARPDPVTGDARIVMTTTRDGRNFTPVRPVDDTPDKGHQLMPTLAFAGGRLMLVYYDLRETMAATFDKYITDQATVTGLRHTIDIRAAMARPGSEPKFAPSVKVSDYLMGYTSSAPPAIDPATGKPIPEQLQFNPPNLPMFAKGTAPFMGDYIDVAAAQTFVPLGKGKWGYNTGASGEIPVFHAVWTDNRDVRPPAGGDWSKYTPVRLSPTQAPGSVPGQPSPFDPTQNVPICQDGNAGSRNQNIYSSRITAGLLAGSPGNTKPLSPDLQRGFVVFAQNATDLTKSFRMTILNQPPGGRASFEQFPQPPPSPDPVVSIDMMVPPRSTASRTVYATSTDPKASISVDVSEILGVGLPEAPNGLEARVMLNPDIENPDIENPDIENPDIENLDIMTVELYNPDIENPDIENPDIENPDIENPDIENPDIENVVVVNPDIENIAISNPDIENPDIENPDIENPDIENPNILNGTITDISWNVSNDGNTTSAFNVNLFLAQAGIPAGIKTQLILRKIYKTPVTAANGCDLKFETRNILIANIPNPVFITPESGSVPDQNDPSQYNATMWLAPGDDAEITLRVVDDDASDNVTVLNERGEPVSVDPAFAPTTGTMPSISSQGVGTEDANNNQTDPPLVTPTGANLFFLQMPSNTLAGAAIAPAVRVQVRDNLTGTPVPMAPVVLALGNNTGGAFLTGMTGVLADANGIATFANVAVSAAGTGYTLLASVTTAGVTATAASTPFNVVDALAVTTLSLPDATAGLTYLQTLQSSGGTGAARTWSLASGALPPGLALEPMTGTITGALDAAARGTFAFTVQVADGGVPAQVDTQALSVQVTGRADVSVAVSDAPDPAVAGEDLTYTIQVTNNGPSTATGVVIADSLPASVAFVSASAGCALAAVEVQCAVGSLAPGASAAVAVVVRPGAAGALANTVSVGAAETDPSPANNTATAMTAVTAIADLALTKSDAPDPIVVGNNITYTLTATNLGPSTATNVVVTDTLPSGSTFVSASGSCAHAGGVVTCQLGTLARNAFIALSIEVETASAGTLVNTATATAIEPDPNGGNNTATASTTVQPPVDIALPSLSERTTRTGEQYALAFNATGGTAPYSWSVESGLVPPGLSLDAATGVLSGFSTTTGAFTFTVRVQDSAGAFDTLTVCVNVLEPPVATILSTTAVGAGVTVADLVTSLLGQGVTVSNVQLRGADLGAGVFTGGSSIFGPGFDQGIVLSSGWVSDAVGPNDSDSKTTVRQDPGDPDLDTLSGQATHDATVIEFDFVPSGNQVSFRYVFGSEEYNEYAPSAFNDAFGFYITGPDFPQGKNWALVPGTNQPVAINSINGGNPFGSGNASNPALYRNNDLQDGGPTIDIEADGLTVVLTLTATVTPGVSHHMKLAIADAFDFGWDSWVFIAGGSFHAVENCTNGIDDDGDGLVDGNDPDCQVCPETVIEPLLVDASILACGLPGPTPGPWAKNIGESLPGRTFVLPGGGEGTAARNSSMRRGTVQIAELGLQ
jgi:uncharacterized repeat protein (TIGR01451 family)